MPLTIMLKEIAEWNNSIQPLPHKVLKSIQSQWLPHQVYSSLRPLPLQHRVSQRTISPLRKTTSRGLASGAALEGSDPTEETARHKQSQIGSCRL